MAETDDCVYFRGVLSSKLLIKVDVRQTLDERLRSLSGVKEFLKPGITFGKLGKIVHQMSDNDFARILRKEERKLPEEIRKYNRKHNSRRKSKET